MWLFKKIKEIIDSYHAVKVLNGIHGVLQVDELPTPGQEGRLIIDKTRGRIYRDTGTALKVIASDIYERFDLLPNLGDLVYSEDIVLNTVVCADSITIGSGITVETGAKLRYIVCRDLIINGTLSSKGWGGAGGAPSCNYGSYLGGCKGENGGNAAGGGGGRIDGTTYLPGGAGGDGETANGGSESKAAPFSFSKTLQLLDALSSPLRFTTSLMYGAGGGGGYSLSKGGNGGGGIAILCESITLNGIINLSGANGEANGEGGGGGGSAGCLVIIAKEFKGSGQIIARGGNGGDGVLSATGIHTANGGAGGNGGLIILTTSEHSYTIDVSGGIGGTGVDDGGPYAEPHVDGENGNPGVIITYI